MKTENKKMSEAFDVGKVIKDMAGDFGKDNEAQMKSLQLLKGLATSDDPKANEFMKKLDKATTAISKEMSGEKKEAVKEEEKEKDMEVCEDCGKEMKDGVCKECAKKDEAETGTFKCPECGSKVLKNTGYCMSCKKKVKESAEIVLPDDVRLPGTDIILEKGDTILLVKDIT